ncbi:MAG: hypothetical protein P8N76_09325 [Pirellulaceae bacterium]|nr:hypothetical protein [Pirellulaceae bacterium]
MDIKNLKIVGHIHPELADQVAEFNSLIDVAISESNEAKPRPAGLLATAEEKRTVDDLIHDAELIESYATVLSLQTHIHRIGTLSAAASLAQVCNDCLTKYRLGTAMRIVLGFSFLAIQYPVRLFPVPHGDISLPRFSFWLLKCLTAFFIARF